MGKQYFCSRCKGFRNHKKLHEERESGDFEDGYILWTEVHSIIQCLGCNNISFHKIYGDSEMVEVNDIGEPEYHYDEETYPPYLEKGNEMGEKYLLPERIRNIYTETISAFKSKSFILTGGGLRAIIEAICNHLKIKKDSLEKRIDLLHEKGHLSLGESKRLHSIRFLGNDALHEIEKPKEKHLYILLEIVNHLLANLFLNDKKLKNTMDTVIDSFDDYLKLVQNKIHKEQLHKELTLTQLLGKSKRLIANSKYKSFEEKFIEEIKSGKINFISIVDDSKEVLYKIEKEPDFTFDL